MLLEAKIPTFFMYRSAVLRSVRRRSTPKEMIGLSRRPLRDELELRQEVAPQTEDLLGGRDHQGGQTPYGEGPEDCYFGNTRTA